MVFGIFKGVAIKVEFLITLFHDLGHGSRQQHKREVSTDFCKKVRIPELQSHYSQNLRNLHTGIISFLPRQVPIMRPRLLLWRHPKKPRRAGKLCGSRAMNSIVVLRHLINTSPHPSTGQFHKCFSSIPSMKGPNISWVDGYMRSTRTTWPWLRDLRSRSGKRKMLTSSDEEGLWVLERVRIRGPFCDDPLLV